MGGINAVEEAAQLDRRVRTLTAANRTLVHAHDEQVLLEGMCTAVADGAGYPLVWVAVIDEGHPSLLRVVSSHGVDDSLLEETRSVPNATSGPIHEAIRSAQTRVVEDARTLPGWVPWRPYAMDRGLMALVAVPLRVDREVFGALVVHGDSPGAFSGADVELFEDLAGGLAFGLSAARARRERAQAHAKLEQALAAAVRSIAAAGELRDPYTAGHQRRVAELSVGIAREAGISTDETTGIEMAAAIHDIGKIAVPAEILSRSGRLGLYEFELVKQHAQAGHDIVAGIDFPWPVPAMVLQHHERMDGSGYPAGLRGPEIVLGARVIALADTVEAMVSHRPYRPGLGLDAALGVIGEGRGRLYDADLVEATVRLLRGDFRFAS